MPRLTAAATRTRSKAACSKAPEDFIQGEERVGDGPGGARRPPGGRGAAMGAGKAVGPDGAVSTPVPDSMPRCNGTCRSGWPVWVIASSGATSAGLAAVD